MPRGEQRGRGEQRDLGRGVEAHAEDHADRVHLPVPGDRAHPPAEEAEHQPAAVQPALELGLVVGAAAHRSEHAHDPGEDHEVQQADQVEERGRDERAEDPAELLEVRVAVGDGAIDRFLGDHDPTPIAITIVECPSENQKPMLSGRLPSFISLRVVLSMAAM